MKLTSFLRLSFAALFCAGAILSGSAYAAGFTGAVIATSPASTLTGKRVLWLGDSITAKGQYVSFVEYFLEKRLPDQKVDLISIGLGSETTSGLSEKGHPFRRPCVHERLQRALEAVKPAVVVACYGMNDGIYHPQSPERMQAFQDGVKKLIAAAKASGAEVILLTPPPFDSLGHKNAQKEGAKVYGYMKPFEAYDSVLGDYAQWELSLKEPGVFVIDLHTPMNEYIQAQRKSTPGFKFAADGIHPNADGHLLMARTILKALSLPVAEGDLSAQNAKISADPLYQLVDERRQARSAGWISYIGYTRGKPTKTDSVTAEEEKAVEQQKKIDALRKLHTR